MKTFPGFSSGKTHLVPLPAEFFSDLLPIVDNLAELKVFLYAIWFIDRQEGSLRYIHFTDFSNDEQFIAGLGTQKENPQEVLSAALQQAVERGTLLVPDQDSDLRESLFFLNTPLGRAALKGLHRGSWNPKDHPQAAVSLKQERPNIFRFYEANIGVLTPIMADTLQEAEENYPADWIEDAIRIAVANNVRRWRYVEAILESGKERGRDERDRRDAHEDPRK